MGTPENIRNEVPRFPRSVTRPKPSPLRQPDPAHSRYLQPQKRPNQPDQGPGKISTLRMSGQKNRTMQQKILQTLRNSQEGWLGTKNKGSPLTREWQEPICVIHGEHRQSGTLRVSQKRVSQPTSGRTPRFLPVQGAPWGPERKLSYYVTAFNWSLRTIQVTQKWDPSIEEALMDNLSLVFISP